MNREIKFRAWDYTQQYMAYQGAPDLETIQSFFYHFGDKKLMQYSGIKDKKGIDIYEGDIVCHLGNFNHEVVFKYGSFGYNCSKEDDFISYQRNAYNLGMKDNVLTKVEIVGNVFNNPELLD